MSKKILRGSFLILTTTVLMMACKKDNDSGPLQTTKLLSAIYMNNIIDQKFFYGADKKANKIENYNPDGSLYKTDFYEYDAVGVLSVISGFLPDGSLKTKMTFTKNAVGQIVAGDFINVGVTSYNTKYEYEAGSNRVVRTANLDAGGVEQNFVEYEYDGSVLKEQRYYVVSPAGVPEMSSKNQFVTTANENKINRYKSIMTSFPDPMPDSWIMYQLLDNARSFHYNGMIVTSEKSFEISEKEYDAEGNLLTMTITIKGIIPVSADIVTKVRYEYTAL